MRFMYFTLVMALVLATAGLIVAQPSSDDMSNANAATSAQATWQQGPIVRSGFPASADVFVNGRLAIRVPASAGGLTPVRRAQIITDRLNQAFAAGMNWDDTRIGMVGTEWTVMLSDSVVATADTNSARAFRVAPPSLASTWARQTVVALGGQPSLVASAITPNGVSVPGGVAGAGAGQMWATSPTKSVPLIGADTGDNLGTVMVAGPQNQLAMVNSVVVYMTAADNGAQIWTFVPITGSSTGGAMTRVSGVGLVGVPTGLVPMTEMMAGSDMMTSVNQYGTGWNSLINTNLGTSNLRVNAPTKVVPLYSMGRNMVVGAAQVVGTASGVANTQAVIVSTSGGTLRFMPTSAACTPMSGSPPAVNNVVVSSLIVMPPSGMPGTTGAGPGMAPETTEPDTMAPETPAPGTEAPDSTMPGTSGSGTESTPAPSTDNSGTNNY